jgi:hypothetical protein
VRVSQPDCKLKHVVLEDVVNVSSSDTEAALEFLTLESGHEVSSRPSLNNAPEPSSSSSVGSEWFAD